MPVTTEAVIGGVLEEKVLLEISQNSVIQKLFH